MVEAISYSSRAIEHVGALVVKETAPIVLAHGGITESHGGRELLHSAETDRLDVINYWDQSPLR